MTRPRLPISAPRLSSPFAPPPMPITTIRPSVASDLTLPAGWARRPARGSRRTGRAPRSPRARSPRRRTRRRRRAAPRCGPSPSRAHPRRCASWIAAVPTPPAPPWTSRCSPGFSSACVKSASWAVVKTSGTPPASGQSSPSGTGIARARGPWRARPGRRRRRSPSRDRPPRSGSRRARARRPRPPIRAPGCPAATPAEPDTGPRRCIMSAPFRPAARTRTSTSPVPGSGSGWSSTNSSPSRTVTAFTGRIFPRSAKKGVRVRPDGQSGPGPPVCFPPPQARERLGKYAPHGNPPPLLPPLWRESRIGFELAGLLRSDVWRGDDVADGNGQPVMLVSGLLAGDHSLSLMARWLKSTGHRPCRAGIAVERRLLGARRRAARAPARVPRRGQRPEGRRSSARAAAAASPACSRYAAPTSCPGIVTLGSPLKHQLAVHPRGPRARCSAWACSAPSASTA